MELRAKNSRTINAECVRHCRGGEPIASPHTIPVHATHTSLQTLQNLHVEICVNIFTLRCEFVVHNSMGVKKKIHQHALIFDLLFYDFYCLGESFSFHSLLCDFSLMLYS